MIPCLRACLQMLERCLSSLSKIPKLWEVVMLGALDKEKRKWLSIEDGQKEEEAISRVSGTWNPTYISCPWRWEYQGLFQEQFLEATEPWTQSLLVLPKIQVSPDLKDQEKTKSQPVTQVPLLHVSNRLFYPLCIGLKLRIVIPANLVCTCFPRV